MKSGEMFHVMMEKNTHLFVKEVSATNHGCHEGGPNKKTLKTHATPVEGSCS